MTKISIDGLREQGHGGTGGPVWDGLGEYGHGGNHRPRADGMPAPFGFESVTPFDLGQGTNGIVGVFAPAGVVYVRTLAVERLRSGYAWQTVYLALGEDGKSEWRPHHADGGTSTAPVVAVDGWLGQRVGFRRAPVLEATFTSEGMPTLFAHPVHRAEVVRILSCEPDSEGMYVAVIEQRKRLPAPLSGSAGSGSGSTDIGPLVYAPVGACRVFEINRFPLRLGRRYLAHPHDSIEPGEDRLSVFSVASCCSCPSGSGSGSGCSGSAIGSPEVVYRADIQTTPMFSGLRHLIQYTEDLPDIVFYDPAFGEPAVDGEFLQLEITGGTATLSAYSMFESISIVWTCASWSNATGGTFILLSAAGANADATVTVDVCGGI